MNMTAQERAALVRRSAYAWSALHEGTDAREVLSDLYCNNLTDKSPAQGALMTGELVQWMARFQDCYDAVLEDPRGYPAHVLKEELGTLPLEQQCQVLDRLIRAWGPEERQTAEHPVSLRTRDALLEEVLGYLDSGADALEEYLPPAEASELQERDQVKAVCGEDLTLAMNTMVLYTMAQNGELPPMPGDGSLAQTAIGVCGEDLMRGISRDEQSGYVRQEETAQRRCALLTASRITLLQAGAALAGGLAALTLLPVGLLGTLGTCGALLAAVGAVMTEKFRTDSRMLEGEADELPRLSLELPHRSAPWSGGSRERTSRTDVSHEEAEQAEVQDVSEEFLLRPF